MPKPDTLAPTLTLTPTPSPLPQLLRLTAMRAVVVLYNPKDQQGCQRRYTTSETLAMMAMKCQKMRRRRMRSNDSSSCARVASRYFSKHLLKDGSGTKWTV